MGLFGGSSVQLPPPPTFQRNPYTNEIISFGLNTAKSFINQDGTLSPSLQEAISTDPRVTQLVLQGLRDQTAGDYRTGRQNIVSQLEANNQLTGSTTANVLGNYETDYLSGLTAAGAEAGIADITRALGARISLATAGQQGLNVAGNQALTDQEQENDFNLSNYDNLVAQSLASSKAGKGGILGGLAGGIGGFLGATALAPFTGGASYIPLLAGGLGAASGAFGPEGTGGSILNSGAGLYGFLGTPPNKILPQSGPKTEEISDTLRGSLGKQGGLWANL